jgi:hypothetical protein
MSNGTIDRPSSVEQAVTETEIGSLLKSWLKLLVFYWASGAKIATAIFIGLAVIRGIFIYIKQLFSRRQHIDETEAIRLQLGRILALGWEFTCLEDI